MRLTSGDVQGLGEDWVDTYQQQIVRQWMQDRAEPQAVGGRHIFTKAAEDPSKATVQFPTQSCFFNVVCVVGWTHFEP